MAAHIAVEISVVLNGYPLQAPHLADSCSNTENHTIYRRGVKPEYSRSRARCSVQHRTTFCSWFCRPVCQVSPLRVFAPCIWQAPRPAATFGSFWSLQKEHAVGREFGEMWTLSLVFAFIFLRQPKAMRRGRGHGTDFNGLRLCFKLSADRCLLISPERGHPALVAPSLNS